MTICHRCPARDVLLRMLAWAGLVVTYLTLWSTGLGWVTYWWAWLFVLVPVLLTGLLRRLSDAPERPADGFVLPRVRFSTSHRSRRRRLR